MNKQMTELQRQIEQTKAEIGRQSEILSSLEEQVNVLNLQEKAARKALSVGDIIVVPGERRRVVVCIKNGLTTINAYDPYSRCSPNCIDYDRLVAGLVTGEYKVVGNIYRL